MATVIDALVVTLGLDPRDLKKGQREAETSLKKVEKSSADVGKSLSHAGETGAQAIRSLSREALSFFAVLTAGKSLKAFVQDNTRTNVALGNLSRNLGVSTRDLGAWQNVAESFGGTADDVSGSMQSLVSQFQTIDGRRNLGITFGQLGVSLQDANGQMRSMSKLLPDLAQASQRMSPQLFSALVGKFGSQGFINMLEQGPQKMQALYSALQKYAPSAEDTQASGKLLTDWTMLTAQSEAFGRTIMTSLTPELHDMMQWVSALIDKNQGWIRQDIPKYAKQIGDGIKSIDWREVGTDVKMFADYLRSIDWKRVENGVEEFARGANSVATAVGGWGKMTEYLFALWLGSKFLRVVGAIRLIASIGGVNKGPAAALLANPLISSALVALSTGYSALKEIDYDRSEDGITANRKAILDRKDPYYSWNRYSPLEQNQIQHALFGYGVGTLHRDPRDVAAMLAEFKAESGFNTQAIGDKGTAIGMLQWHRDREKWIEQQAGKSITSMTPQEQMKWAFAERDARYSGISKTPAKNATAAQFSKILTAQYVVPKDTDEQSIARAALASNIYKSEIPLANLNASRDAARIASSTSSSNSTDNSVSNTVHANVTVNAPGADGHAIAGKLQQKFNDPRFIARQSNRGLQ